jgi:transposase-like protein
MERYAMNENRVVALREKGAIDDPLTEILRAGARRLIAQAVEAEFETFLGSNADLVLADGRQRVVRHGHDPVRAIQTGIGSVDVEKPKARDRGAAAGDRIRFTSAILPKWARRTKSLDALLPVLYLRGVSAGDFQEALAALLGKDAPNLSPAVIARLKSEWEDEYRRWQDRDLSARRYVYVWADGVYLQARMEPQAECMLVLIGATPEGVKELIGFQTGMRESAQSWRELLVDLKARGLSIAPELAIGDGALGFWNALDEALPTTRHQRCWLHKTTNVLDKFPKSLQPNAHKDLREIWLAPDRASAEGAMTTFAEKYAPKYDKAVDCLIKDRETLLTFFDFPADHWDHLRTTNPIESVFATVRHRTVRMKGALSQHTARLMVFKLVMAASKTWRRLQGQNQLPKVVKGAKFRDGIEVVPEAKFAA